MRAIVRGGHAHYVPLDGSTTVDNAAIVRVFSSLGFCNGWEVSLA